MRRPDDRSQELRLVQELRPRECGVLQRKADVQRRAHELRERLRRSHERQPQLWLVRARMRRTVVLRSKVLGQGPLQRNDHLRRGMLRARGQTHVRRGPLLRPDVGPLGGRRLRESSARVRVVARRDAGLLHGHVLPRSRQRKPDRYPVRLQLVKPSASDISRRCSDGCRCRGWHTSRRAPRTVILWTRRSICRGRCSRAASGASSQSKRPRRPSTRSSRLRDFTGASIAKRQVEELAIRAAQDFDAFYEPRAATRDPKDDLL